MTLRSKITHEWDVEDESGNLVHIAATKDTVQVSMPNGERYFNNVELRELARAANAAARV